MRSSQGAAISDLAVHRTLRVGFSPVAAAAPRGTARGRRGASAAHARRRRCCAGGCRAAGAALSAATDTQAASTWNIRRRMFVEAASHRWWAAQAAARAWDPVNGIETWMTGPRCSAPPSLHESHRSYASEAFAKPLEDLSFLLVFYMPLASLEKRARHRSCGRRAAIALATLFQTRINPACSAAVSVRIHVVSTSL